MGCLPVGLLPWLPGKACVPSVDGKIPGARIGWPFAETGSLKVLCVKDLPGRKEHGQRCGRRSEKGRHCDSLQHQCFMW